MPTRLENLNTSLDNVIAELAAHDQAKASYSAEGRSFQWDQHYESLMRRYEKLNEMIKLEENRESGGSTIPIVQPLLIHELCDVPPYPY